MDDEKERLYEERIAALEMDRATLYAEKTVSELRGKHRIKIRDPKAFTEKLAKAKLVGEKEAQAVIDDAMQNYARDERAPVSREFLPIARDVPTDGPKDVDDLDVNDPETVEAVTRYAEDNKIDIVNTEDGWDKAVEGFAAAKKKKAERTQQRQTA